MTMRTTGNVRGAGQCGGRILGGEVSTIGCHGAKPGSRPTPRCGRAATLLSASLFAAMTLGGIASSHAQGAAPAPAPETLPSGVKVEHLKVGTGAQPAAADTVKVHYRG